MRLTPSEPDVRTLIGRIADGDINLQPDFQRGEVWPVKKKQRLIDTILRQWHIPPVHLIELPERKLEVLDGQQRLIAIRDFARDEFPVDGTIEPSNDEIRFLHGLRYNELPPEVRRLFNQYPIRVIGVADYNPAEVGELFLRLNQPANLTTAEQRNAFFGEARSQIKAIVGEFRENLFTSDKIGFSNSRMAYEDVIARLCFTLEVGNLWSKVGANDITTKYRSRSGFDATVLQRADRAIRLFGNAISAMQHPPIRFNKATLFSWFLFYDSLLTTTKGCDAGVLGEHIYAFERSRNELRIHELSPMELQPWTKAETRFLLSVFNDRASARVADVMSIVVRDFALWFTLKEHFRIAASDTLLPPPAVAALKAVASYLNNVSSEQYAESEIEQILIVHRWRPL
jgi:hypothetical protein